MVMLIDVKLNVMLSMPSNGNVNWCKTQCNVIYTKQLGEVTWYQIKCNGYQYQVVGMLFNVK